MGTSSRLAVNLDATMLAKNIGTVWASGGSSYVNGEPFIAPPTMSDDDLTRNDSSNPYYKKNAATVSQELGGRYLLTYLYQSHWKMQALIHAVDDAARNTALGRMVGTNTFVTPTPLSPEETIPWLALPSPWFPRDYVLLIDPTAIGASPICGRAEMG